MSSDILPPGEIPFPLKDVLGLLASTGGPPSGEHLQGPGPFVEAGNGPFLSRIGTRASQSTERPGRQLKPAPPTLVPVVDFSTMCLESIFRPGEWRLKKDNQLSKGFSANCWIHLSGLSRFDECCMCLNFYSKLHVKFFAATAAQAIQKAARSGGG